MPASVLAMVSSSRVAWQRAETWSRTPVPVEAGLALDALLEVVPAAERPWLQRTVHAGVHAMREWLRELPGQAGGWGAGPDRFWAAW